MSVSLVLIKINDESSMYPLIVIVNKNIYICYFGHHFFFSLCLKVESKLVIVLTESFFRTISFCVSDSRI